MTDLEAELARTSEREPIVQAWAHRHGDDRLRELATSLPEGPLTGWTLGVKDVIDTADLPTERGSAIYEGRRSGNDATCVSVARQAGALVVGKTTTTEFALVTPTVTTNPHNQAHTPGGSSSGSAAAVADGMVRAAFGTQTVGSVLRPAAYCGVVGYKPTHQLVPVMGVASLAPSFDTVGWFTRSVTDAQTLLSTLADQPIEPARKPRRIGCYRSQQWSAAQPEMAEVLDTAADRLRAAGVEVIDLDPLAHLNKVFSAANTVLFYEIARVFAWERATHPDLVSPLLTKMLAKADGADGPGHGRAQRVLAEARWAHQQFMTARGFDALLTPSAPGEAPPIKTTGDSVFNRVWTSLGVPAVQLPTGVGPLGLPVGVQLTSVAWGDADLLAIANWAETVLGADR